MGDRIEFGNLTNTSPDFGKLSKISAGIGDHLVHPFPSLSSLFLSAILAPGHVRWRSS